MDCWGLSKHKAWLYWSLMLMMIPILMFGQTQGNCTEDERKALLEIKASLMKSFDSKLDHFLPTWVDNGSSTPGDGGGDCCEWERVSCNSTSGHVTELSLFRLRGILDYNVELESKLWALNVSLFLHFKELTSLNLSFNLLEKENMKKGFVRLSSLNKLEVLDLSMNHDIDNDILPSLTTLTSLKILDLSYTNLYGNFPTNEFAALENLERLDLSVCLFNGTFEIQSFGRVSILTKLKTLNLQGNGFNKSVITSLSSFQSLTNLDLSGNELSGSFPAQELSHLTNLEELDLSSNKFNDSPHIQDCRSLSRLKRLTSIDLSWNYNFNKSIISCLSALPSLKILDLTASFSFPRGGSFPVQEFVNLFDLEVLVLSANGFNGTLPMEAFTSFHHLRVLDLSGNRFVGSIPSTIQTLFSLEALSFGYNYLNGSLSDHGLCELKNLRELDLSHNMLDGALPQCLKNLSFLKLLDISSNQFAGILPPSLIGNLTSLEYIDFSDNKFEGSFSFSSFSTHTKLEVVRFGSDNDKFEVETEEPAGWIPMFQLNLLVLSNCNLNRRKGHVVPGFLLHQIKLQDIDMSHNSLGGQFPNWLIKNNTNLEKLNLRNNSLIGSIQLYWNANMKGLDISSNQMVGSIPHDIPKFLPNMEYLDLSKNVFSGVIPSSIGDLSVLSILDLSDNELSGEVPKGLFTNISLLSILKLSRNKLHGQVLSGNLRWGDSLGAVYLDSNNFTGTIGIKSGMKEFESLKVLDISNNFFTGMIPDWLGNMSGLLELVVRNNSFEGWFPCGAASFSFLDISHNSFSGPIPSCLKFQDMEHLHLGSNKFTGPIPNSFRNLTNVLTLDMGYNNLSGRVPDFIGQLSDLRILVLRNNNFSGSIPKQLCQLSNASLIDLSDNFLSDSIPNCLQNIIGPTDLAFIQIWRLGFNILTTYQYGSVLFRWDTTGSFDVYETRDEVQFTTKSMSRPYKGDILDYMSGLDLSCNKLTGEIPEELGLMTHIHAMNLSHNQLTGPIPLNFSNLANLESLDLSSNGLSGKVPSELIQLTFLEVFNASHNNLSGRLPEMKAQFGTFGKESYEGNPLLCGLPLEKKCTTEPHVNDPSLEEEGTEKWYDVDMTCLYGSSISTLVMLLLGFVALLYINPYWRRRWLDLVEECMYKFYYFLYDSVRKSPV